MQNYVKELLSVPPPNNALSTISSSAESSSNENNSPNSSKSLGRILHELIEKRSETLDNWAYEWWLDDMYLKNKLPLPIWSNPGIVFPAQNFVSDEQQLRFAARLVAGILDYKTIIDAYASGLIHYCF